MLNSKGKVVAILVTLMLSALLTSAVSCRGKGEEVTPPAQEENMQPEEAVQQEVEEIIDEIDSLLESLDPGAFDENAISE